MIMELRKNFRLPGTARQARRGVTLVEMMFTVGISALVMGGLMMVYLEVARESQRTLAETVLQQNAGLVQDRISLLLRAMSMDESVIYTAPVANGSGFFRKIVIARGASPAYSREELYFDLAQLRLVHDPNRTTAGNEENLFNSDGHTALRNLYFFPSLKAGGALDSSAVNVIMELDDNGSAGRRLANGTLARSKIIRSFTVKMRNP